MMKKKAQASAKSEKVTKAKLNSKPKVKPKPKAKPKTKAKPKPRPQRTTVPSAAVIDSIALTHADPEYWNTTEDALTADLNEDLGDAWLKIREFGASLGEQRIYASGKAIMFSKRVCYFFVRPKRSYLEVVIFLNRMRAGSDFSSIKPVSKTRYAHTFKLVHADQVEGELTEALQEAFSSV